MEMVLYRQIGWRVLKWRRNKSYFFSHNGVVFSVRSDEWEAARSILATPETQFAIYRETTALKQFDNKLIELCTLNRGHSKRVRERDDWTNERTEKKKTRRRRRYAEQDMDAFPFSKGLVIMAANVITSFLNIVH